MFCTACGNQIGDGAEFCAACGRPVGAAASIAADVPSAGTGPPPWPAPPHARGAGAPPNAPAFNAGVIVGGLGAIAIVVGALASWTRPGSRVSAFKIPVAFLLDKHTTSSNPKLGYLLIAAAVVSVACALLPRLEWACFVAGAFVILAVILFIAQFNSVISESQIFNRTLDYLGPGPFIAGAGGVVLALVPIVRLARRSRTISAPRPQSLTTE